MKTAFLAAVVAALATLPAIAAERLSWADKLTPAPGPAESIGGHALGCIAGAEVLPLDGAGYQVLRPQRNRHWGHPALLRFVQDLAAELQAQGIGPILVADLGQPRGGPVSGHGSHQSGLDADIWFRLPPAPLAAAELETPTAITMVNPDMSMTAGWGEAQARMLRQAALHPEVDRIFVNAAIKRAACRWEAPDRRDWLRKVRPWYGHDAHFHVRLRCQPGDSDCDAQSALPPGDGCGDLDWWFSAEARAPRPKPAVPPAPPPLPARCEALLGAG